MWKKASILPLLKKANLNAQDLGNYRPISRLPAPAKLAEKVMNNQLTSYLHEHSLLDEAQFEFRAEHSTETALKGSG